MSKRNYKNRKDSHGYVLRVGEYERPDGRYEIDQGLDSLQGQMLTLDEIYDMYMHMKRGIKVSARRNYNYIYDKFVRDNFGKKLFLNG